MTTVISARAKGELRAGSARVVLVTVNNSTPVEFTLVSARTMAGAWNQLPPASVQPYSQVQFLSESEGFLGGNKASVNFTASTKVHSERNLFEVTFTIVTEGTLVPHEKPQSGSASSLPAANSAAATVNTSESGLVILTSPKSHGKTSVASTVAQATASTSRESDPMSPVTTLKPTAEGGKVLTLVTYTYNEEPCDEAFCRKFANYDVVCIQGVRDEVVMDDLRGWFRFTHAYSASLGPKSVRGCGLFMASKAGIITALPLPLSNVSGIEGKIPTGGVLACKLDVGPLFRQCSFWVFHTQHADTKLDAEPCRKELFDADSIPADATPRAVMHLRRRKLLALRDFICDTISKEDTPGCVAVVITGDFGIPSFKDTAESQKAESRDMIPAVALDLNNKARVGFSRLLTEMLRARCIPIEAIGQLRSEITVPRIRSLLLTEVICHHGITRKLAREYNGRPTTSMERYRTFAIDSLDLVNHSWNAQGPVADYMPEYWRAELKEKIDAKFPGTLDEKERSPTYDLRSHIVPFQLIRSLAAHLHVTLTAAAITRILKYPGGNILPSDIEDIVLPGLHTFQDAPSRKLPSSHLMTMCALDARDVFAEATRRVAAEHRSKKAVFTSRILSLDHAPLHNDDSVIGPQLAIVNCIDGDVTRISEAPGSQVAVSAMFSVTSMASANVP